MGEGMYLVGAEAPLPPLLPLLLRTRPTLFCPEGGRLQKEL